MTLEQAIRGLTGVALERATEALTRELIQRPEQPVGDIARAVINAYLATFTEALSK